MNRKITVLLVSLAALVALLVSLSGCGLVPDGECKHEWKEATCTAPKTCTLCEATEGEALGHSGGSATCTEKATCSLCNEKYGELAAHDFADASCTEAKKCKNCTHTEGEALGHTGGKATCKDKAVCTRCSQPYGELIKHSFTATSNADIYLASAATCTTSATYFKSCAGCGEKGKETFSYGEPLKHDYELEHTNDDATHTLGCKNCDDTKVENCFGGSAYCGGQAVCSTCNTPYGTTPSHAWDDGVVTTAPTCTEDGVRTLSCTGCTATTTVAEPKTGHDYDSVVTAPTCTVDGYTTHTCKNANCGDSYVDAKVVASGHKLENVIKKDSTCTEPGHTAYQECAVCDYETLSAVIAPKGHDFGAATCTSPATCSRCPETQGAALGHDMAPATCTEPKTCKRCSATDGAPLGHVWEAADCLNPKHCSVCKITEGESLGHSGGTATCNQQAICEVCSKPYGAYAEHAYGQQTVATTYLVSPATCKASATYYESCLCGAVDESKTFSSGDSLGHEIVYRVVLSEVEDTVANVHIVTCLNGCGMNKTEECSGGTATCQDLAICEFCNSEYGELIPHSFGEWVETPAGCTTTGSMVRTCSSCGASETETIPAPGHDYVEVATAPTCTEKGYTTFTCSNCNDSYTGAEVAAKGHDYNEDVTSPTCTEKGYTTFSCKNCDHSYKGDEVAANGHNYGEKVIAPTCISKGYTTFSCKNCDHTYNGNETEVVGHSWDQDRTCTEGHKCTVCSAEEGELGHDHVAGEPVAPTCTEKGYTLYTCSRCNDSYKDNIKTAPGHDIYGVEAVEVHVSGCDWKQTFKCKDCGETIDGQTVAHHTYVAAITTPATCKAEGVKTLTCSACGDSYTESIASDATGHNWVKGTPADGKRTDTCSYCNETKTVIDASGQTETKVDREDLKNEVALKDANLDLSGIAGEGGALDGKTDLEVSAGQLSDEEKKNLGFSDEELAQVGNNPIYNFTITEGVGEDKKSIHEFGENNYVTVTLPYTLSEGEDVDSIAVWYIDNEGKLTSIEATYANGYVTFKTNHFSYYTVTRLTPAERCALYGHNFTTKTVKATCTEDGYTLHRCIRCGFSEKKDIVKAAGHDTVTETIVATCTTSGKVTVDCKNCAYKVDETIPATGHKYSETSRTDASCAAEGHVVYSCTGCTANYSETIAKLKHNYTDEVIKPDCTNGGYTTHTCSACGDNYKDNHVSALKHDYDGVVTEPTCSKGGYTTYTCKNEGCEHSYVGDHTPTVDHDYEDEIVPPSCGKQGYTKHDCRHCGHHFEDNPVEAFDHEFDDDHCKWDWDDDHKKAHITLTCKHGCGHKVEGDVESNGRYYDADCNNNGRYEHTVKFTHNGMTFTDKRVEESKEDLAGHRLKDGYTHNEHEHWIGCKGCSEKHYLADHEWDEGVVTKKPTCDKDGEIVYTCYCGRSVKEKIPATEDHYYRNGHCVVCGMEQTFCDHTELIDASINFADFGYCENILNYQTCSCGEVKKFDMYNFNFKCNIVEDTAEQGGDGVTNMWVKMTAHCDDCKIIIAGYMLQEKKGCEITASITYTFYHENGEEIITVSYEQKDYYHTEGEPESLGIETVSSCGTEIWIVRCTECGVGIHYADEIVKCSGENLEEYYDEWFDEDGTYRMLQYYTCKDCGFTERYEGEAIFDGPCVADITLYKIFLVNGIEYGRTIEQYRNDNHNYKITNVEMKGETCVDGYIATMTCTNCGDFYYLSGKNHDTEYREINLSDYGMCEGYGYIHTCNICNEVTNTGIRWNNCSFEVIGEDNGYTVCRCSNCNTELRTKTTLVNDANKCAPVYKYEQLFYHKDELVLDLSYTRAEDKHNYEYTVEGTCDDYNIKCYCLDCGHTKNISGGGHYYVETTYNLADYGICEGTMTANHCIICGINFNLSGSLSCDWEHSSEYDGMTILQCKNCQIMIHVRQYEIVDGCKVYEAEDYKFYKNNEELLAVSGVYTTSYRHEYEQTVTGDCENGYTVEAICKLCGDRMYMSGQGHRTERVEFDLKEYGFCGGDGYKQVCTFCGKTVRVTVYNDWCSWQLTDEKDGVKIYTCDICGGCKNVKTTVGEKDENCYIEIQNEVTFFMKDELVFGYTQNMGTYDHDMVYNYIFDNPDDPDCEDGVTAIFTCNNCDHYEEVRWNSHQHVNRYTLDTASNNLCENHYFYYDVCPCGKYASYDFDRYNFNHEDNNYSCPNCSMVVNETENLVNDGCAIITVRTANLCIDGVPPYAASVEHKRVEHDFKITAIELEDGTPYLTFCCEECGYSFVYTKYESSDGVVTLEDHNGEYYYDLYFTSDEGGYYNITSNTNGDTHVTLYRVNADSKLDYLSENDDGAENNNFSLSYSLEAGVTYVYRIRFLNRNMSGEISYSFGKESATVGDEQCNHSYENKVVLPEGKDSCEDGVYRIRMCDCGAVNGVDIINSHNTYLIERYNFSEYGACGFEVYVYSCACGQEVRVERWNSGCDSFSGYHEYYTDENGVEHTVYTQACVNCQFTIVRDYYLEEDGCYTYAYSVYTYKMGEEEICTLNAKEVSSAHHKYIYTYEFQGEENCESGVRIIGTCEICGNIDEWYTEGHFDMLIGEYDLSEYGACTGAVAYHYTCPCGQIERIGFKWNECRINATHTYYVDDAGYKHTVYSQTCLDCGLVYSYDYYQYKEECCLYTQYVYYSVKVGETDVVTTGGHINSNGTSHDYEINIVFHDDSNHNCEAGYTITYTCRDCGNTNSKDCYSHSYVLTERVDLSSYTCYDSAYLEYRSCACGLKQDLNHHICSSYYHTNNTYVDENGRLMHVETRRCDDCGIRLDVTYYDEKAEGCFVNRNYYAILTAGDEILFEKSFVKTEENHDMMATGSLNEGSKTCDDGVTITYQCRDCGYSYTKSYTWHHEYERERIDATKYGSECGGYISIYGCACGYYSSINTDGLHCDTSNRHVIDWIEGDLNEHQETADGGRWFETNAYLLDCAVTDDADGTNLCDFAVRYATYWIKNDDCSATKYFVIQLGYNANDDSWVEEKLYTLQTRTFHDYGDQISTDNGWKYECPDCGSWYSGETVNYENNEGYYHRYVYENKLDDGCTKYRERIDEWKNNAALNLVYHSKSYNKYIYANGREYWECWEYSYEAYEGEVPFGEAPRVYTAKYSTSDLYESTEIRLYTMYKGYEIILSQKNIEGDWWYQHDYTWSFEGGCSRTYVYTDAKGETTTGVEDNCHISWWPRLTSPTCSQQGIEGHWCPVCETIFDGKYIAPEGHNWIWLADDLYYCYDCGLQGQGGSNGDVIIEDLTEQYGNGEKYVLGYYNKTGVAFTIRVSLIFYNAEWGDYDQIVLELEPTLVDDLYRGAYISKAAVKAAAEELGFAEGEYEVRMSFVPDGADSSFDYAITFGDLEGSDAADFAVHDDASMVVYAPLADFTSVKVVSETTANWRFYSVTHNEVFGRLIDENGNVLISGYNYDFNYTLEAGKTYYLQVYHTNTQGGYVAVLFDKQDDVIAE